MTQAKQKLTAFKNIFWRAIISKGLNAMPALSKFLVLFALVFSISHSNAFTSLSLVAGNQVWVNHLTRLQQLMSDTTNEPSREPVFKPTKRMDLDAVLLNNLSQINNAVLSNHSNQRETLAGQPCCASKQPFTNQQCCAL